MLYLVVATLAFVSLFLVFSLPVVLLARREPQRYRRTVRSTLIVAVALGVFCAVVGAISRGLVAQCEAVDRNNSCIDAGADGLQVMIVAGFAIFAGGRAYLLHID